MRADGGQRLNSGHLVRRRVGSTVDGDPAISLFARGEKIGQTGEPREGVSLGQATSTSLRSL
jgi:hypothetical protein